MIVVTASAIANGSGVGVLIALLLFGGPCGWFTSRVLRRGPILRLDSQGLTDGLSGRMIPWDAVSVARARTDQGLFNEYHSLVVDLEPGFSSEPRRFITTNANDPDQVEISLDGVSMPWREIVEQVEKVSGRRVVMGRSRFGRED